MSIASNKEILEKYVPFGKPVPYKQWLVYPIQLIDYFQWDESYSILTIDKNSLNNIDIIKMSYLEFLITQACFLPEIGQRLDVILRLSLHISKDEDIRVYHDETDAHLLVGKILKSKSGRDVFDSVNACKISSDDFDELKRIILYQNIIGYDDRYIDPEVREAAEEYYRLKNRNNQDVSLEQKIAAVQAQTGMSNADLNKMTLRQFLRLFEAVIDRVDYPILKMAEGQGAKFTTPPEHWVFKKNKDKYAEAFTSLSEFQKKISV